jgi:SAM-dependent methyltransferase
LVWRIPEKVFADAMVTTPSGQADARAKSLKKRLVSFWNSRDVYWDLISTTEARESPQGEKAVSFLPEGGRVLDVACGSAANASLIARRCAYVGADILPTGLHRAIADDAARRTIAEAARELVLREHTYDRRIDTFLELLNGREKKRYAPARTWPEERVRMAYLEYFAANGALQCALAELPAIARRGLTNAAAGSAVLARARGRRIRALIRNRFARGPGLGTSKA